MPRTVRYDHFSQICSDLNKVEVLTQNRLKWESAKFEESLRFSFHVLLTQNLHFNSLCATVDDHYVSLLLFRMFSFKIVLLISKETKSYDTWKRKYQRKKKGIFKILYKVQTQEFLRTSIQTVLSQNVYFKSLQICEKWS